MTMVIASRQKTETFVIAQTLLGIGATVNSNILRCKGYGSVHILVRANVAGTVRIFESITNPVGGPTFIQTNFEASVADPISGEQVIFLVLPVHGEFMRISFVNGGVIQAAFQIIAYLMPEGALGDDGSGGGGGGGGSMSLGRIYRQSTTQDLALAPLSLTTAVAVGWKPRWVALTFDVPLVATETLKIAIDSGLGVAYDVVVELLSLAVAASADGQAYMFAFPPEYALRAGDEVRVTLTNAGGSETALVSAQIIGERCGECGEDGGGSDLPGDPGGGA